MEWIQLWRGLIKIQTLPSEPFVTFIDDDAGVVGVTQSGRVRKPLGHQSVVDRSLHSRCSILISLLNYNIPPRYSSSAYMLHIRRSRGTVYDSPEA